MKHIWIAGALVAALATWGVAQAPLPGPMVGAIGAPFPYVSVPNAGTDVICALHADVIAGLTCNNAVTDGTTETAFSMSFTLGGGSLTSVLPAVPLHLRMGAFATATIPTYTIGIKLGSVEVYTAGVASLTGSSALEFSCSLTALAVASSTTPILSLCAAQGFNGSVHNTLISNTAKSVAVNTLIAQSVTVTATFSAATTGNAMWLYAISPI